MNDLTNAALPRVAGTADVAALIDARPLSGLQLRVVALCGLVMILDSFDSSAIGFVAPRMAALWHLAPGALGPVFAWGFLGQFIGAAFAGPIADRYGRRLVLIAGVIEFGLASLATTQAHSLDSLRMLRLVTGLGLGAALPNALALVTEISPSRRRGALLVAVLCGMTIGAATAGTIAAQLMSRFGWSGVFLIGGLLPLALVPVLLWALPESPYFLALKADQGDRLATVLRRIDPGLPAGLRFVLNEERPGGLTFRHLFRAGRAPATVLLFIVVFMNNLEIYVFASWLPTLARASGLTESASIMSGVGLNIGGLAGTIAMAWLMSHLVLERLMAVLYAAAAASIGLLALVAGAEVPMMLGAASAGFCIVAGQMGANALLAFRHPTFLRATALSSGLATGRIASIIGPLGTGWVIALGWSPSATFMLAVVPAVCASMAVLLLGRHRPAAGD
ncbi:MAG TPA: MFS transporter [Steroidobacteraceae bacterium]|nr:MFS transporter [Steroidobacteraceae bacterium]